MPSSKLVEVTKKLPPREKDRKNQRRKEAIGEVIVADNYKQYQIEDILGSGGFGDVYQVFLRGNRDKKYAMKTERYDAAANDRQRRLGIEATLYTSIQSKNTTGIVDKTHFAIMVTYGKTSAFKFLIMEIVGPSLFDIRKKMLKDKQMRPHTIATIARQTLISIEALHDLGWLHRDVKPHNFAIGLGAEKETTIFLLDFGIARAYREQQDGRIKPPRKRVHWMGTKRYTSARGQRNEEQARRDDCESWCFMMLEFYWKMNVVWSMAGFTETMIIAMKVHIMAEPNYYRNKGQIKMPQRFGDIMMSISKLTFTANPDYAGFYKILQEIIKDENIDMTLSLDWIGRTMPADAEKEKFRASARAMDESLTQRRKKLEEEMVQLYKDIGEPRTLEEVKEEIRQKGKKERKKKHRDDAPPDGDEVDYGSDRSEAANDKEKERKKTPEKAAEKDRVEKKVEEEKISPIKESKETIGPSKETIGPSKETISPSKEPIPSKEAVETKKITKDMVRAMLVVIAARNRFDTGETVEYLKMADELKGVDNQAVLDRMYQALDNYETYMDDQTMLRALKEIIKEEAENNARNDKEKDRKKTPEKLAEKREDKGSKKGVKEDKKQEKEKKSNNRSPAKAADEKKPKEEKKKDGDVKKEKPSPSRATPPAPAATKAADPATKDVGVSKKK